MFVFYQNLHFLYGLKKVNQLLRCERLMPVLNVHKNAAIGGKVYARNSKISQYSQHDYLNKLLCQTKSNYFFPKASFREYFHLKFVMFHFSITIVFFLLPVKILFYKSIGWVNSAVLLKGPLLAFRFSTNDSINMMSPLN